MIKVGITGNICSGYDKVSQVFKSLDVPVFDADINLKFLLNYREEIIREIKIQFTDKIYNQGLIDGSKFNTTEKFNRLLLIAEPELMRLYDSWRFANKDASYTIFKSSILFEKKFNEKMNYNICVFKPREERASLLSKKITTVSGSRITTAYDILDSEMDELLKNQRSEWIIHNYDDFSLISQVREINEKIEAKSIKNILKSTDFNSVKNMLN